MKISYSLCVIDTIVVNQKLIVGIFAEANIYYHEHIEPLILFHSILILNISGKTLLDQIKPVNKKCYHWRSGKIFFFFPDLDAFVEHVFDIKGPQYAV